MFFFGGASGNAANEGATAIIFWGEYFSPLKIPRAPHTVSWRENNKSGEMKLTPQPKSPLKNTTLKPYGNRKAIPNVF
jgi:hypothetical protein